MFFKMSQPFGSIMSAATASCRHLSSQRSVLTPQWFSSKAVLGSVDWNASTTNKFIFPPSLKLMHPSTILSYVKLCNLTWFLNFALFLEDFFCESESFFRYQNRLNRNSESTSNDGNLVFFRWRLHPSALSKDLGAEVSYLKNCFSELQCRKVTGKDA